MFTLLRNAHIFAPEEIGVRDIFIANGKIALIQEKIEIQGLEYTEYDLEGATVIPGLIDNHVHITGGGGEGGYTTRTPEIRLSSITAAGVTTVCGLLGTDGTTRSLPNLLAKARALEEEGITTFVYSGAYRVPTPTITGSVQDDMIIIDKCIGAGEIALSDHRSAQPTVQEYKELVAQVRVGGMLSGKAGIVNFHVGDGERCLNPLREIVNETELPYTNMLPTHVNRNSYLFEDALAYVREGGYMDITSGVSPETGTAAAIKPSIAIRRALEADLPLERILMSSDGNGSMPVFDEKGRNIGVGVADQASLLGEMRDAILQEGCSLADVLPIATANVARLYKFENKGVVKVGADADLVVLTEDYQVSRVWAKGRLMVEQGQPIAFGVFEKRA